MRASVTKLFQDYITTTELRKFAEHKLYANCIEVDSGIILDSGEKLSKCKLWQGSTSAGGYGLVYIKTIDGIEVRAPAHRLAWFLRTGSIPDHNRIDPNNLMVLHGACNNPLCVEHIRLGTQRENGGDTVRDGNSVRGEKNNTAKLTESQAMEIYKLAHGGVYTQDEIGNKFNITRGNVSSIKRKKSWEWIHVK